MNEEKNTQESIWKKYFSGREFLINGLIALVPASLVVGILREIGVRGGLVTVGILWGFIYLAGLLREKAKNRKQQKIETNTKEKPAQFQDLNENKVVESKPFNKKIGWIILACLLSVSLFSLISTAFKVNDTVLEKTDKSSEYSEQIGNLYRNTKYNFRIIFPDGWEQKQGDGPNILQKATKDGATISVLVRKLPTLSNESFNIEELSGTENEFMQDINKKFPGAKLLDSGMTKIDNEKAFWIRYKASSNVLGIVVEMINTNYMMVHNNIFYTISAGSPDLTSIKIGSSGENFVQEKEIIKSVASFVFEDY